MTETEKWDALHKTALSDHGPTCRYGQTNGREMCTCEVLVELVEGTNDENPEPQPAPDPPSVPADKPDRLAAARAARARNVARRRAERAKLVERADTD